MKIKLTCSLAGAEVLPAGTVIDTTAKEAASMVAAGYAEYVEDEVQTADSKKFATRPTTDKKYKKR